MALSDILFKFIEILLRLNKEFLPNELKNDMAFLVGDILYLIWTNFATYMKIHLFLSLLILLPQIKYPGADMDITLSAPSFCRQISPEEFEYQRAYGSQEPLAALLEEVITDAKLSNKEKKKKLKQVKRIFFRSHFFCLLFLILFFLFILYFNGFQVNLIFWDIAVLKVYYSIHIFQKSHGCTQLWSVSHILSSSVEILPFITELFVTEPLSVICPLFGYVAWCELVEQLLWVRRSCQMRTDSSWFFLKGKLYWICRYKMCKIEETLVLGGQYQIGFLPQASLKVFNSC